MLVPTGREAGDPGDGHRQPRERRHVPNQEQQGGHERGQPRYHEHDPDAVHDFPRGVQVEQHGQIEQRGEPERDVEGEAGGELGEHDLPIANGSREQQFECAGASLFGEEPHRDDAGDGGEEPPEEHARGLGRARDLGPAEEHLHGILHAARPAFVQEREREVELQPGEHEEPEHGDVADRPAEVSGELASEE